MDGNIPTDIGNNVFSALNDFYIHIFIKNVFFNDIHDLFDLNRIRLIENIDSNFKKINKSSYEPQFRDNYKYDSLNVVNNELKNYYNDLVNIRSEFKKIGYSIENKEEYNTIINNMHLKYNMVRNLIIESFNLINDYDSFFYPSGWVYNNTGHLIGFYYQKLAKNKYRIVITNSGLGISKHKIKGNLHQIICEYNDVDTDQLIKLLVTCLQGVTQIYGPPQMSNNILLDYNDEAKAVINNVNNGLNELIEKYNITKVTNKNEYYNNICNIFNKKNFSEINFTENDNYYQEAQLSGSCTFYGIYYFIYYYYEKLNKLDEFLKIYNENKISMAHDMVNYITKMNLTDEDMNILIFFNQKYNIDISSAIKNHIEIVKDINIQDKFHYDNRGDSVIVSKKDSDDIDNDYTVQLEMPLKDNKYDIPYVNNLINEINTCQNIFDYVKLLNEFIASKHSNKTSTVDKSNVTELLIYIYNNMIIKFIIDANTKNESFYDLDIDNKPNYEHIKSFLVYSFILIQAVLLSSQTFNGKIIIMPNQDLVIIFIINFIMKSLKKYNLIKPDDTNELFDIQSTLDFSHFFILNEQIETYSKYASYIYKNGDRTIDRELIEKWNLKNEHHDINIYNDYSYLIRKYLFLIFHANIFNDPIGYFIGYQGKFYGNIISSFLNSNKEKYSEKKIDNEEIIIEKPTMGCGKFTNIKNNQMNYDQYSTYNAYYILFPGKYVMSSSGTVFIDYEDILKDINLIYDDVAKNYVLKSYSGDQFLRDNTSKKYNELIEKYNAGQIPYEPIFEYNIIKDAILFDKGYVKKADFYFTNENINIPYIIQNLNEHNYDCLNNIIDKHIDEYSKYKRDHNSKKLFPMDEKITLNTKNETKINLLSINTDCYTDKLQSYYYYKQLSEISIGNLRNILDKLNTEPFIILLYLLLISKYLLKIDMSFDYVWIKEIIEKHENKIIVQIKKIGGEEINNRDNKFLSMLKYILNNIKKIKYYIDQNNNKTFKHSIIFDDYRDIGNKFYNITSYLSRTLLLQYIVTNPKYFDKVLNHYYNLRNNNTLNYIRELYPTDSIHYVTENLKHYLINNKIKIFGLKEYISLPKFLNKTKYIYEIKSKEGPKIIFESISVDGTKIYENRYKFIITLIGGQIKEIIQINNLTNEKFIMVNKITKTFDGEYFVETYNEKFFDNEKIHKYAKSLYYLNNEMTIWKNNNNNEYKIEFYSKYDENKNIFSLKFINEKLYYNDYVIDSDHYIFNRFAYGIKNVFIIRKSNNYKILLINNSKYDIEKKIEDILKSKWINIEEEYQIKNIKKLVINDDYDENMIYTINIHNTGLFLDITNKDALFSYFIECSFLQKTDILDTLYTIFPNFLPDVRIENIFKYPNTPYNFYFNMKYNFATQKETFLYEKFNYGSNYGMPIRENYYISKYKFKKETDKNINIEIDNNIFVKFLEKLKENNKIKNIASDSYVDNISEYIDNDIKSFLNYDKNIDKVNGEFFKCEFDNNINLKTLKNIVLKCEDMMQNTIDNIYRKLDYLNLNFTIKEIILINYKIFYKLLQLNKITDICQKLNELICTNNMDCCSEAMMLTSIIDEQFVYTGKRDINIAIFEILFGNYIRNDQFNKFNDIIGEIETGRNYKIHHMLMGKGKTSVITPLILFNYLFNSDNFSNIVIVLPKHLINQTYDLIIKKYGQIMDFIKISKMVISRKTQIQDINDYFNISKYKNIIVTDLSSLQSIQLNMIENNEEIDIDQNKTLFIFDEIDSLCDPIVNELNYPIQRRKDNEYDKIIIPFMVEVIKNILETNKPLIINEKQRKQAINSSITKIKQNYTNIRSHLIEYISAKVFGVLDTALQKIYNKDFGFDNSVNSKNKFIAIPYSGVNNPIYGSEFTELEIKLAFTTLSYFIVGLRTEDTNFIINIIKNLYREYINFPILLNNNELYRSLNIDIGKIKNVNDFNNLTIDTKSKPFISYYLIEKIFPTFISQYDDQYNCSFIDIAGNNFCKYKIGFSGTVSGIHMDGILNVDDSNINIFNKISNDPISSGAIYSAFLGTTQDNEFKPKIFSLENEIDKDNILKYIVDMIKKYNYNALIDTGALLIEYKTDEVINNIIDATDYKTYMYINENDKIITVTKNNVDNNNIFVYYDQKHTIGIDIAQPYILKGLVTVNYFNKFTDVSQGMYRLRKMNFGHTVDFLLTNINKQISNTKELLVHLIDKDNIYKNSSKEFAILQQIKYLRRKHLHDNKSYIDKVFYNVDYIKSNDDLNRNIFLEYIHENYCKNNIISINILCRNLNYITNNLLTIQNNIEEQQEQHISEEISSNIQQQMSRNYQLFDYSKIDKVNKYFTWILDDYINCEKMKNTFRISNFIENIDMVKLIEKIHTKNLYLSPTIFSNDFDIVFDRDVILKLELIQYYNFYLIQCEDSIMIIKGWEYTMLNNFLIENNVNLAIYDKNCVLIYKNGNLPTINNEILDFCKFIMGGKGGLLNIINSVKFLLSLFYYNESFEFLDIIEYYMLTINKNDNQHNLLHKINGNKNIDQFIYNNLKNNPNEFIKDIFNIVINHDDLDKVIKIINSSINDLAGGNKNNYYHKYLKYKNKYMLLRK
jgi:hypothetical protein